MASVTEAQALAILRADDADRAARAEALLWRMWSRSGRADVDELFGRGVAALEQQDFGEAETFFSRVIETAPDFAEGWNKRATVRYLAEDFPGSIADCRETLARKPHHFGALAGQGLCHMALEQHREASDAFRRALEVHPHLTAVRNNLRAAVSEVVKYN